MGFWKSFTKGIGSAINPTSWLDLGDSGNVALDYLDPGNTFHTGSADRLANQQFALQSSIAKKNYDEQVRMNDWNIKMQEDAYAYQKVLNEQQRQDNLHAVENRVADLKAAGLSPTLAAGSAANVTPVHAGSAPQGVAPQMATPSDIKVQQAMFKAQLEKDYMQLAVGMLGNFADISRTKAETELIRAQKDRYIAETPIELRLKTLLQEQKEVMNPLIIKQTELGLSIDELKKDNQVLTNAIASNTVAQQALELVIKQAEADNAGRKYRSEADKLEEEVKEKSIAVMLAEHVYKFEEENGIPISAMSPVAKTFIPIGKRSVKNINGDTLSSGRVFSEYLDSTWFGKGWNKLLDFRDKAFGVASKVWNKLQFNDYQSTVSLKSKRKK